MSQHASPHPTVSPGQFRASCEGASAAPLVTASALFGKVVLLPLLQDKNVETHLPVTA